MNQSHASTYYAIYVALPVLSTEQELSLLLQSYTRLLSEPKPE